MRRVGIGIVVALAGCQPGIEGTWIGKVDCDTLPFNVQVTLEQTDKLVFAGPASQTRSFETSEGFPSTFEATFNVVAALAEPVGVQDVTTTFTCATQSTTTERADGTVDLVEGCEVERYADYRLRWDGETRLQLRSDAQNCEGVLEKRG